MADKLGPQILRPVSTATAPDLVAPRFEGLDALADSLSNFGQNVTTVAVNEANRSAKAQGEKGQRAAAEAMAQGKTTIEELVKDGIISKGSNPFFRDGVFSMIGQARADKYGAELTIAAAEAGLQDSLDEQDFDNFIQDFSEKFNQENPVPDDAAISDGFAQRANQYLAQMRQKHAGIVADNITKKGDEALAQAYRGIIVNAEANVESGAYVNNITESIKAQSETWLETLGRSATSGDKGKMNDAIVSAVESGVLEGTLTGTQAKDILKGIMSGTGTLWSVPRHFKTIIRAESTRSALNQSFYNDEQLKILKTQREAEGAARSSVWQQFGETGQINLGPILEQVAADPSSYSPDFASELQRLGAAIQEGKQLNYRSNINTYNSLYTDILQKNGVSVTDISRRIGPNQLNPSDASFLIQQLQQQQDQEAQNTPQNRMWSQATSELNQALGGFAPTAVSTQATINATPSLWGSFEAFMQANPNATPISREFVEWKAGALEQMQNQFLDSTTKQILDDLSDQQSASFATEKYSEKAYTDDVDRLIRWVAETELMLDPQVRGDYISDELHDFFAAPGRAISEEAASNPLTYKTGLMRQLQLLGVKTSDKNFKKKVDAAKKMLINPSPQTLKDTAGGASNAYQYSQ